MSGAFFTVGHSNRSLEEFLELLEENEVDLVVDVRRLPGSSKHPHFDEDALGASLREVGVELVRSPGLTGRRPVSKTIPFEVNAWWQNRSFHNYADHALSEEFRDALEELRSWGSEKRVAVMCAEAGCGGGATGGSSRTSCWLAGRTFSTSWGRVRRWTRS